MKAKACTKCRQWKARCDVSDDVPGGCSRCRSLNLTCVFDASYKRLSKERRIQQMSAEIQQLRETLRCVSTASLPSPEGEDASIRSANLTLWETQLPGGSDGTIQSLATPMSALLPGPEAVAPTTSVVPAAPVTPPYRTLGEVNLSRGQVERYFKTYFTCHHKYLPFKVVSESPDEVHSRSYLLFWVICAVTSNWKQQAQLAPLIRAMITDTIHATSHSVETIQALLIMCMWPFKMTRLSEDPSQLYSGITAQMSLQLGLHRPNQPYWPLRHGGVSGPSLAIDEEVRLTTWLACYVVNLTQSAHVGVPPSIVLDTNSLRAIESPTVDRNLSQLCRVYHLLMQFSWEIGANAPTPTGMAEPTTRITMIRHYREQLLALEQQHLAGMNDLVKISFLYAKLQLYSFVLVDDMARSIDLLDLINEAEATACELIDITYSMNLSVTPNHLRRTMTYAAFVLIRLLQLPHDTQRELLYDSVERVRQALSTTISAPDDVTHKACEILQKLPYTEDKGLSPPIASRMGASILFDSLRAYWEHCCFEKCAPEETFDIDKLDWSTDNFDWAALGL